MDGFSNLGLLNEQDTIVNFKDDWLPAITTDEGGKAPLPMWPVITRGVSLQSQMMAVEIKKAKTQN